MIFVFTPDLIKYEEEFILEANSLEEVIEKLQEECPINCSFGVYTPTRYGIHFIGVIKLEEGKSPEWVQDHDLPIIKILITEDTQ